MNPTRWAFLYHGIQRNEMQDMELQQVTIARALGLGAVPIRDRETGKLKMPTKLGEMAPLLFAVARPTYLEQVTKLWEEMDMQEKGLLEGPDPDAPSPDDEGLFGEPPEDPYATEMQILQPAKPLTPEQRQHLLAAVGVQMLDADGKPVQGPSKRSSFILDDEPKGPQEG